MKSSESQFCHSPTTTTAAPHQVHSEQKRKKRKEKLSKQWRASEEKRRRKNKFLVFPIIKFFDRFSFWTSSNMSICDSEENRKKLAWLVPGYILLAWFFCVLFQPLGIRSPNSRYHPRLTKYGEQIIYLTSDEVNTQYCRNNGSVITLEMGQRSAVVIRLGRIQHHMEPFLCSLRIKKGHR